jgi:hypothetical protein
MIPNSRMGSVIGKQGSKIKEIQDASGARLNASEGMLPGSTEVRVIYPPSTYSYANSLLSSLASSQCCRCRRRDPYRNLLHRQHSYRGTGADAVQLELFLPTVE